MAKFIILLYFVLLFTPSYSITEIVTTNLDDSFWFIQIYKPNCPNCHQEEKQLQKVQKIFQGIIKLGKISIQSLPASLKNYAKKTTTYILYKGSINDFAEYKEKVSRISIAKYLLSQIQTSVKARDKKYFGTADKKQSKQKEQRGSKSTNKDGSGVIVLDDQNFQQKVLASEQAWFVQFYSPSCGHCHALQPQWDKLPSLIGKRVNIAKIDATKNRGMAQKYKIQGFPTLFLFSFGKKQNPVQYSNQRTAQAMISWLNTQKIGEQKREFMKLSKENYAKQCNKNIVCLIFILDKKSELKKLDFVKEIIEEQKSKPLRFFYSSRLQYFEQDIMIEDRATPKLVSIWDSINSYKVFNGSPDKQQVDDFLSKIMERRSWIKKGQKIEQLLFKTLSDEL